MENKKDILTENERLFNKVSYKHLLKILNKNDVNILSFSKSTNSYGIFQFITIKINKCNEYVTFYGLGLHEYRNRYFIDEFHFYTNYYIEKDVKILNKKEVIKKLAVLYKEIKKEEETTELGRTANDVMFEELADMADDDAVISLLY